jgi:hypothetical protein
MEVRIGIDTLAVETRFVYRVDGPVPDHVREALNIRYRPNGWTLPYQRRQPVKLTFSKLIFFDISTVTRPADPIGYWSQKSGASWSTAREALYNPFPLSKDRGTPSR